MTVYTSLGALLCLAMSQQALAAPSVAAGDAADGHVSIVVSTTDLRLDRAHDRHVLHWRLQAAAERLCGSTNGLGIGQGLPILACQRRVLSSAHSAELALVASAADRSKRSGA